MWNDPIIEETRKLRDEYARQFNYDLWAMLKDLQEKEKKHKEKIVSFEKISKDETQSEIPV
jgi:hypothetical protein